MIWKALSNIQTPLLNGKLNNPFASSEKTMRSAQGTVNAKTWSNKLFDFLEKDNKTRTFFFTCKTPWCVRLIAKSFMQEGQFLKKHQKQAPIHFELLQDKLCLEDSIFRVAE